MAKILCSLNNDGLYEFINHHNKYLCEKEQIEKFLDIKIFITKDLKEFIDLENIVGDGKLLKVENDIIFEYFIFDSVLNIDGALNIEIESVLWGKILGKKEINEMIEIESIQYILKRNG